MQVGVQAGKMGESLPGRWGEGTVHRQRTQIVQPGWNALGVQQSLKKCLSERQEWKP